MPGLDPGIHADRKAERKIDPECELIQETPHWRGNLASAARMPVVLRGTRAASFA